MARPLCAGAGIRGYTFIPLCSSIHHPSFSELFQAVTTDNCSQGLSDLWVVEIINNLLKSDWFLSLIITMPMMSHRKIKEKIIPLPIQAHQSQTMLHKLIRGDCFALNSFEQFLCRDRRRGGGIMGKMKQVGPA